MAENRDVRLVDRLLVHQVHPAKIGADVAAALVSNLLLWRGRAKAAVAVRVALPLAGSGTVLGFADLDALAMTRRGHYVLTHMPPSAQAVRLAGDAVMALGARRHSRRLLLAGAVVIAAGWSQALWVAIPRRGRRPRRRG
jgi:hypothetical protein